MVNEIYHRVGLDRIIRSVHGKHNCITVINSQNNNQDYPWDYKHYMLTKQFFN